MTIHSCLVGSLEQWFPTSRHLCMVPRMSERLTASDWLQHGLRVLTREGPGALKAAPMAQALNVSRGSFYWHFRDIEDFRARLLQAWEETSTDHVIEALDARPGDPERLSDLLQQAFR